jgi:hypothetical protein
MACGIDGEVRSTPAMQSVESVAIVHRPWAVVIFKGGGGELACFVGCGDNKCMAIAVREGHN